MIAEDDPIIGDMICEDLLTAFPKGAINIVGPATSYQEGIEILRSEHPDIALLDIELGSEKTAGILLAHYINKTSSIPVIFLSGLPRESGFELAKLTFPFAFVKKPYREEDLTDQIELLMIRQSQRKRITEEELPEFKKEKLPDPTPSIFVVTGHGELTRIPVGDLVLLEADDKIIRAFLLNREKPVIFSSPGLKNFFEENHTAMGVGFFQLNRKHVLDTQKILAIKNNHVILPKYSSNSNQPAFFSIPIPQNGDKRKELLAKLGRED